MMKTMIIMDGLLLIVVKVVKDHLIIVLNLNGILQTKDLYVVMMQKILVITWMIVLGLMIGIQIGNLKLVVQWLLVLMNLVMHQLLMLMDKVMPIDVSEEESYVSEEENLLRIRMMWIMKTLKIMIKIMLLTKETMPMTNSRIMQTHPMMTITTIMTIILKTIMEIMTTTPVTMKITKTSNTENVM